MRRLKKVLFSGKPEATRIEARRAIPADIIRAPAVDRPFLPEPNRHQMREREPLSAMTQRLGRVDAEAGARDQALAQAELDEQFGQARHQTRDARRHGAQGLALAHLVTVRFG